MEIINGVEIVDLALYLKRQKILIICDSHIGYEEELNKKGFLIPRFQFREIVERLRPILEKTRPRKIIINGDIKHEFGAISEEEWRNTLKLIDFLLGYGELVLLKGNHDTILGPIASKRKMQVLDHYFENGFYICHGHQIPEDLKFCEAKTVVIGHEHPAISIGDAIRTERYKCFLLGKWKDKRLVVIPSLNQVTEGTDILQEQLLSPFLTDISGFEVFVVGEEIYDFGKVGSLLRKDF